MAEPIQKDDLPAIPGKAGVAFVYGGTEVTFDADRMVNLTEMWRAEGCPPHRDPRKWRSKEGRDFIADTAAKRNVPVGDIIRAQRGRGGATWGHYQVAMAYAKYLSHDFHRFVNEVFRRWMEEEADPSLRTWRWESRPGRRTPGVAADLAAYCSEPGCGGPVVPEENRRGRPFRIDVSMRCRSCGKGGLLPNASAYDDPVGKLREGVRQQVAEKVRDGGWKRAARADRPASFSLRFSTLLDRWFG